MTESADLKKFIDWLDALYGPALFAEAALDRGRHEALAILRPEKAVEPDEKSQPVCGVCPPFPVPDGTWPAVDNPLGSLTGAYEVGLVTGEAALRQRIVADLGRRHQKLYERAKVYAESCLYQDADRSDRNAEETARIARAIKSGEIGKPTGP